MALNAGSRLGPYEVLSPLGAGGMGEVYRARDTRLERDVALKVLPAEIASETERLKRFEREARSTSSLNHPNIVTVYDIGVTDGTSWIAMERVEGTTLRELLVGGSLPTRKLLQIAPQIAEGLAKAHEAGILHRDLKPENLMVTKDGVVKILDFGLAKLASKTSGSGEGSQPLSMTETTPGVIVGTVSYMSPEQASAGQVDFRSDQFSLGSILYELATGKRAFQKKTSVDTLSAILNEEPEPMAAVNPQAPVPLRWIVERCLSKEPEERYAATKDLARDLISVRDRISDVTSGSVAAVPSPRRRLRALALGLTLMAAAAAATWLVRGGLEAPLEAPRFTRLTFRQGAISNARFAPDGRTVVYGATWQRDPEGTQLYQTVVGSPESRAFDFRGDILAISQSNELAIRGPSRSGFSGPLALVPMSGGTPRQVLENVNYAGADFSPDGELAISRTVDGKKRVELPPGKVLVSDAWSPRFSPDGETIAFWDDTVTGRLSLGLIDREGKSKRTLATDITTIIGAFCWKPDGREIWVTAGGGPGEQDALWAFDLSGRRRLVMRVPGNLELFDISKDGKVLLGHHTMTRTIRGATAADPRDRDLSWLDWSIAADISADGKTLLFTEDGEASGGEPTVYIRGMDGSPAVRLGEGRARALSPDGKWALALTPPVPGKPDRLLLLPTGIGEERALDTNGFAFTELPGAGWLPDGRGVVFSAAPAGGASRIWVLTVPDGKPRPISPEGFRTYSASNPVSPDGRFVVGVRGDVPWRSDTVLLFPLDGAGQPRTVPGLDPKKDWVHQWTSDMRALYVSNWADEWPPIKVWLLDLQTGQKRFWKQIEAAEQPFGGQSVMVTPDGSAWVYSAGHTISQLYVVDGLR